MTDLDRLFQRHIDETDKALAGSPVPVFDGVRRSHRRHVMVVAFVATVIVVGLPVFFGGESHGQGQHTGGLCAVVVEFGFGIE